jgi:hypothetical protein
MQVSLRVAGATLAIALTCAAIAPLRAQETGGAAQSLPAAPAAAPAPAQPQFPPVGPANFTAASPTREAVEQFLKVSWGYDTDRVWQVYSIENTPAPNVAKVTVHVAQKNSPQQIATLIFYVTPDGKHLIANDVLPFGANPYVDTRRTLESRATGPSRGSAD